LKTTVLQALGRKRATFKEPLQTPLSFGKGSQFKNEQPQGKPCGIDQTFRRLIDVT
jgi:hypothetical protein